MYSIKKLCQKFGKKPSEFTDNRSVVAKEAYSTTRGRNGDTKIDEALLPQFLMWLHVSVANKVMQDGWKSALKFAEEC